MRIAGGDPGAVQAKMSESPDRAMRGNPLARATLDDATATGSLSVPVTDTCLTRTSAFSPPVRSI